MPTSIHWRGTAAATATPRRIVRTLAHSPDSLVLLLSDDDDDDVLSVLKLSYDPIELTFLTQYATGIARPHQIFSVQYSPVHEVAVRAALGDMGRFDAAAWSTYGTLYGWTTPYARGGTFNVAAHDLRQCTLLGDALFAAVDTLLMCGVHHRDISPANVVCDSGGGVALIDYERASCALGGRSYTEYAVSTVAPPSILFPCTGVAHHTDATERWSAAMVYALQCARLHGVVTPGTTPPSTDGTWRTWTGEYISVTMLECVIEAVAASESLMAYHNNEVDAVRDAVRLLFDTLCLVGRVFDDGMHHVLCDALDAIDVQQRAAAAVPYNLFRRDACGWLFSMGLDPSNAVLRRAQACLAYRAASAAVDPLLERIEQAAAPQQWTS